VLTILERIRRIIVEQLGADDEAVVPSASLTEDLNVDSSDLAELIAAIEIEFSNIKHKLIISANDIEDFLTVQDLIDYLRDHIPED
jgi:acyl carrier protein